MPRFWTLVFLLGLQIAGGPGIYFSLFVRERSSALQNQQVTIKVIDFKIALWVMDLLSVHFTKMTLVGVLNYVQVRNVARSRHTYWLLKGALVVTLLYQISRLIMTILAVYFSLLSSTLTNNSHRSLVESPLFNIEELVLGYKTTELILTKLLQGNKCIIGKHESNSFSEQNAIESI